MIDHKNISFVAKIVIITASYYVLGRLGLFLAIPPGYTTAIWPSSGVALVGVLIFGYRIWPGIFAGSFLINVWTTFDASSTNPIFISVPLAALIAGGAALQACLGARLIRRFVGYPTELCDGHEIVNFMGLNSGACLVSCTVGVTSLFVWGQISLADYLYTWGTWWVGDVMGVFVFTPFLLIWVGKPSHVWQQRRLPLGVPLAAMFTVVSGIFAYVRRAEDTQIRLQFDQQSIQILNRLERQLTEYSEVMYGLRSFYAASPRFDRNKFRVFVAQSLMRHSGIQQLEWIPRVLDAERRRYEKIAGEEGYHGFYIWERNGSGAQVSAATRETYYPRFFAEPDKGNIFAQGFDYASDPVCLQALTAAENTGEPTVTQIFRLSDETNENHVFLIFIPVYENIFPGYRVVDHRKNLEGFILGTFRIDTLVTDGLSTLTKREKQGIDLAIVDQSAAPDRRQIYKWSGDDQPSINTTIVNSDLDKRLIPFQWQDTFDVFGRKWTLLCIPNLNYPIKQPGLYRWIVLAGGFSITGILGMFLLSVTGVTIKMENIVKDRTQELLQYQDNLAELVKERTRELEITQGRLVRKERLAAVGRISGSIAHDLRNPLSAIGNAVYYLKRKVPESESKCRQYLEIIDHEVKLSGNVITNLLDLTSKGGLELEEVSLNSVIDQSFVDAHISDQIIWRLECNPDPFMLQADPGKLAQVLQNLLTNATQAMHGKGEITIIAKRDTEKNVILFRDSGPGIDMDHHKFIFEPLYSTKIEGIGLGLWICREIITLHGGNISLEDQDDKRKGACFKIELPIN